LTTLTRASLTLQTARLIPPRFAPGLSTTHRGFTTGTQASPRTGLTPTGRPELIASTSCRSSFLHGAEAVSAHPRKGGTRARSARWSRQHESRSAGIGRWAREHPLLFPRARTPRPTHSPTPRPLVPQPTRDRRRQRGLRPSHRVHQAPRDRGRACSTSSSAGSHSPTIPKPPNS